jgi:hypothetical protein
MSFFASSSALAFLVSFMTRPFKNRPPAPSSGDSDPDTLYLLVGRSLTMWEFTETQFARLFSHIIRPGIGSGPAKRAYGGVVSSNGRKDLIQRSSDVFFRFFPNGALEERIKALMENYMEACARRNDIAHGVVISPGSQIGNGYYLAANLYTSKRSMSLESPYHYDSNTISRYMNLFDGLASEAAAIVLDLDAHFYASPEKHRERY